MHPDDLKTLDDLRKFPFTTKAELREKYPFGLMAMPREQLLRMHASSGTTGKPTVVGYSRRDIETWADIIARSMRAAGCRPGMLAQNSYGYGLFTGGLGFHHGAEKLGLTVVPVSGGMTERQVKLIGDFKPDVIFVTPSYLLAILDEFRAQGVDPRQSLAQDRHVRRRALDQRHARGDRGGVRSARHRQLRPVGGDRPRRVRANASRARTGCTIWEDHFYPEVIDPATGAVLPDGEVGELVFTSLTKEAMPVIRYRTRDLSRLLPGTARSMRRMEKVIGRSDDMMIIRGVNVFPSQIEEIMLKDERLAPHFVIELRRDERLDAMTVVVEARAEHAGSGMGRERPQHRPPHQGADRRDRGGEDRQARRGRALGRQGQARHRPAREKLSALRSTSARVPASRLCICTMNAMAKTGVARLTIGIETNTAIISAGEKNVRRRGACASPWPPPAGESAWRRARNIRGRADRRWRRTE